MFAPLMMDAVRGDEASLALLYTADPHVTYERRIQTEEHHVEVSVDPTWDEEPWVVLLVGVLWFLLILLVLYLAGGVLTVVPHSYG